MSITTLPFKMQIEHIMTPYYGLIQNVHLNGHLHDARTAERRKTVHFPEKMRFNMRPVTSKSNYGTYYPLCLDPGRVIPFKGAIIEFLWMLSGNNNVEDLRDMGAKGFWEKWSFRPTTEQLDFYFKQMAVDNTIPLLKDVIGTIGPMYGKVWRGLVPQSQRDQFADLVYDIIHNPYSSRMRMTSWIPDLIPSNEGKPWQHVVKGDAALAPCHGDIMVLVLPPDESSNGKNRLVLRMFQRSADIMIGLPSNLVQYSFFIHLLAAMTDTVAEELVVELGDAHIYENHLENSMKQLEHFTSTVQSFIQEKPQLAVPSFRVWDEINNMTDFMQLKAVLTEQFARKHVGQAIDKALLPYATDLVTGEESFVRLVKKRGIELLDYEPSIGLNIKYAVSE